MMKFIPRFLLVILIVTLSVTALNANAAPLSAFWANDGGDKVTQHELRGNLVRNRTWDGTTIKIFGAKNEVVNFNLVLEAKNGTSSPVSVTFNRLTGPPTGPDTNAVIRSIAPATTDGVFNWVQRDIELFYVRYLKIRGLSRLSYDFYDERHIPFKMRRPMVDGQPIGGWTDRPHADAFYPDIAVPIELLDKNAQGFHTFTVADDTNQSIWADIYIPPGAAAGIYTGTVTIREGGSITKTIPVQLTVRNFTLPHVPNSKTMVVADYHQIARRYTGKWEPNTGSPADLDTKKVLDRQFMLAHRHKISLIDSNGAAGFTADRPRAEWLPRLDGSLFTAINGYRGPGTGIGNDVFAIGLYGLWQVMWGDYPTLPTKEQVWTHTNNWESWFQANSPNTERFLYLADEPIPVATPDNPIDYKKVEEWAGWVKTNPGVGKNLKTFATVPLDKAVNDMQSLNIPASWICVASKSKYDAAAASVNADPTKDYYFYNGCRPASGSFATEDEGVALRELPWGQYKKGISRWFSWESDYYKDINNVSDATGLPRPEADLFIRAQTFGGGNGFRFDDVIGMTDNGNYSNGDGVLFYPGTDKADPDPDVIGTTFTNYGLKGPIASLRLKHWRRGIQDVDYIHLAKAISPTAAAAVQGIVDEMVPKVMWENGVADPADPTWQRCPISWSTSSDAWEDARERLANIIDPP